MGKTLVWFVAAGLLVGWSAGCGSGSGTSDTGTQSTLTKSQFLKRGNQICEDRVKEKEQAVGAALEKLAAEGKRESTPQDLARLAEEAVLPSYRKVISELHELGMPAEGKKKAEAVITGFDNALKEAEAKPLELAKNNPFASPTEVARRYGLTACFL